MPINSARALRWADIEQGRRSAASTMRGQDAKPPLLILYAIAGFLAGKLSKVSATGLYWIETTTRALATRANGDDPMTTNVPAGTAQIFQFPPRGRFALNARDGSNKASFQMTPAVRIASGSAWYHDAAIEDAERSRN